MESRATCYSMQLWYWIAIIFIWIGSADSTCSYDSNNNVSVISNEQLRDTKNKVVKNGENVRPVFLSQSLFRDESRGRLAPRNKRIFSKATADRRTPAERSSTTAIERDIIKYYSSELSS